MARTGSKSKGKKKAKSTAGDWVGQAVSLLIGSTCLLGAWWWWSTGGDVTSGLRVAETVIGVAVRVLLVVAVVAVAAALLWWRHDRRREARIRLGDAIARETRTDPRKIRVRFHRGRRGSCSRYSSLFDDRPESPERAKVEALISRKVGGPLRFTWDPPRDTVRWEPGTSTPAGTVAGEVLGVAEVTPVQTRVEDAIRAVVKGETRIAWGAADAVGPLSFVLHYPSTFPDEQPEQRLGVVEKVNSKAPGRWRATWDTEANRVRFDRRPNMPKVIPHPAPGDLADTWRIPLGVDEHHETVYWDLSTMPHMLVAGSTGGGKTVALSGLLVEALARGFEVVLVDGKGTALAGFRDWPGVVQVGLGEPEDMAAAMEWAEDLMRDRYRRIRETGADPDDFTPVLVLLDEAAEFAQNVEKWHARLPRTGNSRLPKVAPALDSWRSIARLGREGHVHLVVGIQQAAASFFGGTESREQLPARVACGPLKPEGARMVFGRADVGRDLPPTAKGRATMELTDAGPQEAQVFYTPTPKPDGRIKGEHEPVLLPWRAAAERAHPRTPAAQHAIEQGAAPAEGAAWETVRLGDLVENDLIEVDVDGVKVEARFVSVVESGVAGWCDLEYERPGMPPLIMEVEDDERIRRKLLRVG